MAECPKSFECESPDVSLDVGRVPSYISIVSSAFSCLGSLLIIVAYAAVKDRRRGVQTMVAQLAVADFILASGFIMGAVNFLLSYNRNDAEEACKNFQAVCKVQSLITAWTSITSYIWTSLIALYFFIHFVCNQAAAFAKLTPMWVVIAWVFPLPILLPLLCLGKLGYSRYAASNWCYVADDDYSIPLSRKPSQIAAIVTVAWLWEVISHVTVVILYGCGVLPTRGHQLVPCTRFFRPHNIFFRDNRLTELNCTEKTLKI